MKEGWSYKKLGEVCEIFGRIGFRGYTKADLVDNPDDGAITLSPSNIVNGEMDFRKCSYITWHKYEESPEIKIFPGDILIVKTASVGKTALVKRLPHPSTINPQFVVLKNIRINNLYLSYYLKSQIAQTFIWSIAKGAAAQTVSQKNLAQMLIPVGTLEEQRSIVTRLDATFSHIDALKANAEKQLNEARKLFQAELTECMKPKEGWEEKRIKEVGEVIGGTTPSTSNPQFWGGDVCWISPAELHGEHYLYDSVKKITTEAVEAKSLKELPIGTVILSSRAPIGKIAINKVPMYCNQGFKCVVCKSELYNEYLYWWFYGKTEYLNSLGTGATFLEISKKVVENIIIPIPPLDIQRSIVSHLDSLSSNIRKLEELQQKTIAECDALKQAMLREVFE